MRLALMFAVGLLSFADGRASAQSDERAELRVLYRTASTAYDEGRFEEAEVLLTELHRRTDDPDLLYNIFLCQRELGKNEAALVSLRRYLDDATEVEDRGRLERVRDELACEVRDPVCPGEPEPVEPEPFEPEPVVESTRGPAWTAGWVALGLGVAAGASALAVGARAKSEADRANATDVQTDARAIFDGAERRARAANALLGVAGVAAIVGLVLVIVGREAEPSRGSVRLTPSGFVATF